MIDKKLLADLVCISGLPIGMLFFWIWFSRQEKRKEREQ